LKLSALCKWKISARTWEEAVSELLRELNFQKTTENLLQTALETRETAEPTLVHDDIAMPHCRSILVDDFRIIIGRSKRGIPWPKKKVHMVILFITPVRPTGPSEHMELIKHLAKTLRSGGADELLDADSPAKAMSVLGFEYEDIDG